MALVPCACRLGLVLAGHLLAAFASLVCRPGVHPGFIPSALCSWGLCAAESQQDRQDAGWWSHTAPLWQHRVTWEPQGPLCIREGQEF